MPFDLKKIFLLLLVSLWLFPSCTGSNNPKPVDADGILGKTPKAFYNTSAPNTTNVILTYGPGYPASLVRVISGIASSPISISPDLIQFSVAGTVLTIRGQPGIYEYSPITIAAISEGTAKAPAPAVDLLCINLAETGYSELQVGAVGGAYVFNAASGNQSLNIGGNGAITKNSIGAMVNYQKAGFGTLQINLSLTSATDPAFYKAGFSLDTPTPWRSVQQMYCRPNNVTPFVPPAAGLQNPIVSSVATAATQTGIGQVDWGGLSQALTPDGNYMGVSLNYMDVSKNVYLTGFFSDPKFALPVGATIKGIQVNCFWYDDESNLGSGATPKLTLIKAGSPVGTPIGGGTGMPITPAMSSDFGSSTDPWGTSWLASDINAPGFGVSVYIDANGGWSSGATVHIDYCQMSVYWNP